LDIEYNLFYNEVKDLIEENPEKDLLLVRNGIKFCKNKTFINQSVDSFEDKNNFIECEVINNGIEDNDKQSIVINKDEVFDESIDEIIDDSDSDSDYEPNNDFTDKKRNTNQKTVRESDNQKEEFKKNYQNVKF
jgi:hypothetical protein